jgi:hypothetical protein
LPGELGVEDGGDLGIDRSEPLVDRGGHVHGSYISDDDQPMFNLVGPRW